jgi:hypothetical protein
MPQHLENQLCCPWPSASLVAIGRSGEFAALVIGASIGLPITNLSDIVQRLRDDVRLPFTNHQSLLTHSTRFACSGRASHLSLFTCHQSPNLSLLTNHFSPLTAALFPHDPNDPTAYCGKNASLRPHFFLRSSRPLGPRCPNSIRFKELQTPDPENNSFD